MSISTSAPIAEGSSADLPRKRIMKNYADMETIARNIGDTPAVAAGYGQRNMDQITDAISTMCEDTERQNLPSRDKLTEEKLDLMLDLLGKLVNK